MITRFQFNFQFFIFLFIFSSRVLAVDHDLVFKGWSVTNGKIDEFASVNSMCSNKEYDCTTTASGDGFKQIQVTPTPGSPNLVSGESYIMTIVTDQKANGTPGVDLVFSDVSFVKMKVSVGGGSTNNNTENGIASQQRISEESLPTGTGSVKFESVTDINTGWSKAIAPVSLQQSITANGDTSISGDNFNSKFYYQSTNDVAGLRDGFVLSIEQLAGLASVDNQLSTNDRQAFNLREVQGAKLSGAGGSVDLGGNTVSWVAGEDIKGIWIGQNINIGISDTSAAGLGSSFGYLSFQNVNDKTSPASTELGFSKTNSDAAWIWDPALNFIPGSNLPCSSDLSGTTCP